MVLTEDQKGESYPHRIDLAIACQVGGGHPGVSGQCDKHFGCQILLSMPPFPIP